MRGGLRSVGACGCFVGHGWIAAWKLEFSGWKKFMEAAGFREAEAHVLMPAIGAMDVGLGVVTLLHPTQLTSAWMVVWAFSTALVSRPRRPRRPHHLHHPQSVPFGPAACVPPKTAHAA